MAYKYQHHKSFCHIQLSQKQILYISYNHIGIQFLSDKTLICFKLLYGNAVWIVLKILISFYNSYIVVSCNLIAYYLYM